MTLNLTVFHPGWIAQASDRRLVDPTSTLPNRDDANKCLVVVAADATLLVTYTGVGAVFSSELRSWRGMDVLLGEYLQDVGAPELLSVDVARAIRDFANRLFRSERERCLHAFAIAGWAGPISAPTFWLVHNESLGFPQAEFEIRRSRGRPGRIVATGATPALNRSVRRRLAGRLRPLGTSDEIASILVDAIREAASTKSGSGIGADCAVAMVERGGRCAVAGFSADREPLNISPTVLWATEFESWLVTGIAATSTSFGVVLGDGSRQLELLMGRMKGTITRQKFKEGAVEGAFRRGELKHRVPTVGVPRSVISVFSVE